MKTNEATHEIPAHVRARLRAIDTRLGRLERQADEQAREIRSVRGDLSDVLEGDA